jgi:predicted nucleic acid-binding protein
MERLFVDTSAWLAFVNRADESHAPVTALLTEFDGRLVTTDFVFDETVTVARSRLCRDTAVRLGDALLDSRLVVLVRLSVKDQDQAWDLFRSRRDKNCSFTDCTSFTVMRRLDIRRAAALDDDFRQEGFEVAP